MKVEELQASGVASQEQATAVSMELAASRDANAALQSTLEAERRMHQRKVDHMEEALQFAKKTVTQTEHQSQSQMVAHRRQTMSMCTTESQLKRAQSEKQEIEERLKQKQSDLDALQSRLSDAQNQMSQLQQAAQDMRSQQAEVKEECQYYQGRTQELEAQVTGTLKLLDQQKEDAKARHQKELQKLKRKHELQLKNCEERYNMLKTKATQQLDRFQKVNARKSLGGLDVLGKENTLTGSEKVRVETEPLNLTEGERRRPRRTSVPRVPLANRTNMETSPKIRSQYDSDSETDSEKTFTGLGPEFEETAFVGGCLSDGEQTPLK
jgi:chromosome segregation ATPase